MEQGTTRDPASTPEILLKLGQNKTRRSCVFRVSKDSTSTESSWWKADNYRRSENRSAACEYDSVNVEELNTAEQEIIRHMEKEAFKGEISKLKNLNTKEEALGASPFSRLDPFLDRNKLVRIGGRIKQASISQDTKHPVVLPGQGHISKILARHYHEKALHQGKGVAFNEIRSSGYWIVGGGTMVSRLIHECVTRRELRAKIQQQKMADLPADRLTPTPPFTYCEVDYFGILVRERST